MLVRASRVAFRTTKEPRGRFHFCQESDLAVATPPTMTMSATWACPGVTTGVHGEILPRSDDSAEDKLIQKILQNQKRAHQLRNSGSSASLLSRTSTKASLATSQKPSQASLGTSQKPSTASLNSRPKSAAPGGMDMGSSARVGALPRPTSAGDPGVPCYPPKSPKRRAPGAFAKTWRYGKQFGTIEVVVNMAYGLLAADLNGKSDPYVIVYCAGMRRKTRVIRRTLAPVWEETFYFRGCLDDFLKSGIYFEVYDWDEVGSADVLGEVKVHLEPELRLATEPVVKECMEALHPQGNIVFSHTWKPDPPGIPPPLGDDKGPTGVKDLFAPPARVDETVPAMPPRTAPPGGGSSTPAAKPRPATAGPRAASGPKKPADPDALLPLPARTNPKAREHVMVPVLLPSKFDYIQLTYERFAQGAALAREAEERLARLQGRKPWNPKQTLRSVNSTPMLVRPPSASLFDGNAFTHTWLHK